MGAVAQGSSSDERDLGMFLSREGTGARDYRGVAGVRLSGAQRSLQVQGLISAMPQSPNGDTLREVPANTKKQLHSAQGLG